MCGIFAYASKDGSGPDRRLLEKIAVATEARGPHAFGLAWLDSRGRLKMFKQTGRISRALDLLTMAADARLLIGHCRYATHGDPRNNLNNHPHPCDGGWLVHNGVISGHERINEQYGLYPVTDCDSESLALLIEELGGSLVDRCISAVQIATDVSPSPLAMMALWRSPQRLVAVRAGNPLHLGETSSGHYLASLRGGLPSGAYMVRDDLALSFAMKDGRAKLTAFYADKEQTEEAGSEEAVTA